VTPFTLVNLVRSQRPDERLAPLGCLWLQAALEARGQPVELVDVQALAAEQADDPAGLAEALAATDGPLGLSLMADSLPLAVELARRVKLRQPTRRIVLGGPGTHTLGQRIIERFPFVDAVVRGEGEHTLPALLDAWEGRGDLAAVAGIDARRPSGPLLHTPDRPLELQLDTLPTPATARMAAAGYSYYSTLGSRGCPHACSFCEIHGRQRGRLRLRGVDALAAELGAAARDHGVEFVAFQDDLFLAAPRRVDAVLDRLEAEGLRLTFGCFARIEAVQTGRLEGWVRRGLRHLSLGIEAGSARGLSALNKGFEPAAALEAVAQATALVPTTCFFLWGYPQETVADLIATVQLMEACAVLGAEVQFGQVVPLPGAPLTHAGAAALLPPGPSPHARVVAWPRRAELQALVQTHPDLFVAFRSFATPDLAAKAELLRRLGWLGPAA